MVTPSSQPDSELSFSLPFTQYLAQHGIENDYSDDISLTLIDQFINEDEAASNPVVDEGTCPINNSVTDELNVFDNDMVVVEEPPISPSPPLPPQSPFVEPVFTRPVTPTSPEAAPAVLTQPPMIISQDIIDALSEPWVEVENVINGNVEHPPQPNSPIIEENGVLPERLVVVEAENNIIRSPSPSPPPSPMILSQGVNDIQQPSGSEVDVELNIITPPLPQPPATFDPMSIITQNVIDALAEPWVEERRQGEEMDVENDIIQPSQLSPILGQINNRVENRVEGGDVDVENEDNDDDDDNIIPPTPPHSRSRRSRRPRKPHLKELPQKIDFYDKLRDEHISEDDYQRANTVWNTFHSDVFENFRNMCLKHYELDPAHYVTAPSLSWNAMLKFTHVKLELLTDIDMLHFFKKGIRGGVSTCVKRAAQANNKFLPNYDPSKTDIIHFISRCNKSLWLGYE
ncbi:hypothetical protein TcasGA2_TC031775 [Tribolium castaneum]|nr:hypothetical protein TcasGA2_TC031775 [Tribolium castaneum]